MTSQVAPIQMVEGEPVLTRNARALIGWLSEQEGLNALLGRAPMPGEDVRNLRDRWLKAKKARSELAPLEIEDPIVELDTGRLREVGDRPEIAANFPGMNWRPAVVDLRRVLSFQKLIQIDGLDERLAGAFDEDSLYELCLPVKQPSPPTGAFADSDQKGFTISSHNPNLRIAGGQVSPADVSPGPDVPPCSHAGCNAVRLHGDELSASGPLSWPELRSRRLPSCRGAIETRYRPRAVHLHRGSGLRASWCTGQFVHVQNALR